MTKPSRIIKPALTWRTHLGAQLVTALVVGVMSALALFAWGQPAKSQPTVDAWQFQNLDGPGVPGGNGRSSDPVQAGGTSTVIYNGIPHTFYLAGDVLRHGWVPPTGWNFETLDGAGGSNGRTTNAVGGGSSTVGFGADLHVFYMDSTEGLLRHSWFSAGAQQWYAESLDGPGVPGGNGRTSDQVGGEAASVLFAGTPHVFYTDLAAGDLRHAWWTGSQWQFETLDGAGGTDGRVDGVIAAGDAAVAVPGSPLALQAFYRDDTTQRLRHAAYNLPTGTWQFQDLDGPDVAGGNGRQSASTGLLPTATLFAGQPQVFYGNADSQLRQGWVGSGGAWNFATLESSTDCGGCAPGADPSATLYNGRPAVAHYDTAFGRLLLTRYTGTAWVNEVLDGAGVTGGAGRTSNNVGASPSLVQYGVQLTIQNVDITDSRLRQAWFGPAAPVNLTPPAVSGTATVGSTLTVSSNGAWSSAPTGFAFQWQRCPVTQIPSCTNITGATVSTYSVKAADIGFALAVRVTATNAFGSAAANSAYSRPVPWPAPAATSLSPTFGSVAGATSVVITGTNFGDVTSVTFGGTNATSYTVNSPTQITAVSPAGTVGSANVVVTTATGSTSPLTFTYYVVPTITTIVPNKGPVAGGQSVTVTGSGFVPSGTTVTVGGNAVTNLNVASATSLSFTTPAGRRGAKNVVITTLGGTATATGGYTYTGAPTITSIVPNVGPVAGGQTVTLNGDDLDVPGLTVSVGGNAATSVTVVSATQATFVTPAGTLGPKNVVVTTQTGSATITNGFTYVPPPVFVTLFPDAGPEAGGQTVYVIGANFVPTYTTVTFNGVPATNVAASPFGEVLLLTTPPGTPGEATVVIATPSGDVTTTYTYYGAPKIDSITPSAGPTTGGTAVTITGSRFTGATGVTIGGVAATSVTVVSDTEITAVTGATTSRGLVDVSVTTPNGTGTLADGFTYQRPAPTEPTLATLQTPTAPDSISGDAVTSGPDSEQIVAGGYRVSATFGAGQPNETTVTSSNSTTNAYLAKYDAGGALQWVRQAENIGPGGTATPRGVTSLPDGKIAMTGEFEAGVTFGAGGPNATTLTTPPFQVSMFVALYDADGTFLWAKQMSGSGYAYGWRVTADPSAGIVVTGYFNGTFTFGAGEPTESTLSANTQWGFVASYGPAGEFDWVQTITSPQGVIGYDAASDTDGDIVVTGAFLDSATFGEGQPNATQLTSDGVWDVYVARYDSAGVLQWAIKAGGSGSDFGRKIAVGAGGRVALTGEFEGIAVFGAGQRNETTLFAPGLNQAVFVAEYDASGVLQWARSAGGFGSSFARGVGFAPDGSVATSGWFLGSMTFGEGPSSITLDPDGYYASFVAYYDPGGALQWARKISGSLVLNKDLAVAGDGGILTTGEFINGATLCNDANAQYVVCGSGFTSPVAVAGNAMYLAYIDQPRPGPSITSVAPDAGPLEGSGTVTITGTGLSNASAVRFGSNVSPSFTVDSDTQITAEVPAGSVGVVDVTVVSPLGDGVATAGYRYAGPAVVTSITPTSGGIGSAITISGTGFTGATSVLFGTVPSTFVVSSDTEIIAQVPTPTGPPYVGLDITVEAPGGSGTLVDAFTYPS